MLENLVVMDEESKEFARLKKNKTIFYIQQPYLILSDANKEAPVNFKDVLSIVRYDKALRTLLLNYIKAIQDMFVSDFLNTYDVEKIKQYIGVTGTERLTDDLKLKSQVNPDGMSNLYFGLKLDLDGIIIVLKNRKDYDQKYLRKIMTVKSLNNYIRHGNYIILGDSTTMSGVYFSLDNLENLLQIIVTILPPKTQETFEKQLNSIKYDKDTGEKYIKRYCLSDLENGIFSRIR